MVKLKQNIKNFIKLINYERKAEITVMQNEIKKLSGHEREEKAFSCRSCSIFLSVSSIFSPPLFQTARCKRKSARTTGPNAFVRKLLSRCT